MVSLHLKTSVATASESRMFPDPPPGETMPLSYVVAMLIYIAFLLWMRATLSDPRNYVSTEDSSVSIQTEPTVKSFEVPLADGNIMRVQVSVENIVPTRK